MIKYSKEYWLAHYEYAMGHKPKIAIDTSDVVWTKNNIDNGIIQFTGIENFDDLIHSYEILS